MFVSTATAPALDRRRFIAAPLARRLGQAVRVLRAADELKLAAIV